MFKLINVKCTNGYRISNNAIKHIRKLVLRKIVGLPPRQLIIIANSTPVLPCAKSVERLEPGLVPSVPVHVQNTLADVSSTLCTALFVVLKTYCIVSIGVQIFFTKKYRTSAVEDLKSEIYVRARTLNKKYILVLLHQVL